MKMNSKDILYNIEYKISRLESKLDLKNVELNPLRYYIKNLLSLIVDDKHFEKKSLRNLNILREIEIIFEDDKQLILSFINFVNNRYINKKYLYLETLQEAIKHFYYQKNQLTNENYTKNITLN